MPLLRHYYAITLAAIERCHITLRHYSCPIIGLPLIIIIIAIISFDYYP